MGVYLLIFLILILLGILDIINIKKHQKYLVIISICLIIIFLDGFRWETGTDWNMYKEFFFNRSKSDWMAFEPGYVILNKIIFSIYANYSFFLVILAIIVYSLYFKSIIDYAIFPIITALLFYCSFTGYMGMNRQHLAMAICLLSFRFILSKEFWKFFCLIFIATLFHRSALLFSATYFLNRKFSTNILFITLLIAYSLNPLVNNIIKSMLFLVPSQFASKLSYYLSHNAEYSVYGVIFGSLKRALIFLPLYFNRCKLEREHPEINLMLNIYFLSIIVYVLFNNSIQVFVGRGNLYFGSLFEIFLLPFYILLVRNIGSKLMVYIFIVLFSFLTFYKSISSFNDLFVPYKGIYLNSQFRRELY